MSVCVVLLFGGRGPEHEVSLRSAATILEGLRANDYEIHCVGISRVGSWHYMGPEVASEVDTSQPQVNLSPGSRSLSYFSKDARVTISADIFFPALHGAWGEDGTLQGLSELLGIPCAGSSVLGSAIGMDKDVSKRLLVQKGYLTATWDVVRAGEHAPNWQELVRRHGSPMFVKPATSGSSIGVRRVTGPNELEEAIELACRYSHKVLVEQAVSGREIECAVIETSKGPVASALGEIRAKNAHVFYDYDAKYEDEDGADLIVPADIAAPLRDQIQSLAIGIFRDLELSGFARVDFFLTANGIIYFNEVNTLPGFTSISMFPRMLIQTGMPLKQIISEIVGFTLRQ
ncbi:D-alanine--D-alanine ligase family protein [Neorhizobium sp. DAR64860/K0K1]|uniref:D-alanine--D-alanine ligase family protein n=1 Tax=Neorhizobium sp. DAR64860/K0K1 TaxID=3421955 RepID=UPI003D296E71